MSSTRDIFVPLFCVPHVPHRATWTGRPGKALEALQSRASLAPSSSAFPGRTGPRVPRTTWHADFMELVPPKSCTNLYPGYEPNTKRIISPTFSLSKAEEKQQITKLKFPLVTPIMSSFYSCILMLLIIQSFMLLIRPLVKHVFSTTESRFRPVLTFVAMNVARTTPGLVEMAPPPNPCPFRLSCLLLNFSVQPLEPSSSTIIHSMCR